MAKKHVVKKYFQKNYIIYIIALFVFATAVLIGAIKTSRLTQTEIEALTAFTDRIFLNELKADYSLIIKRSIMDSFKAVIFAVLCCVSVLTSVLSFTLVALKGFSIGFTSGFLIYIYKLKGFWYVLGCIVPWCVLVLPVMFCLCSTCINYAIKKKSRKENTLSFFALLFVIFLIMVILNFCDGFFSSLIINGL